MGCGISGLKQENGMQIYNNGEPAPPGARRVARWRLRSVETRPGAKARADARGGRGDGAAARAR